MHTRIRTEEGALVDSGTDSTHDNHEHYVHCPQSELRVVTVFNAVA
jgi:hypothetical protein